MTKHLILGAGPCGLGAAWRLKELGQTDFKILEALDHPGGLASSYVDSSGFTWDIGGHVQFSHYEDFDRVMELAVTDGWYERQRESWVYLANSWVPYPFQNNLWRLPPAVQEECLKGLESRRAPHPPEHFGDWVMQSFGSGITKHFMLPYNLKVWAHPLDMMSYQWIGERVAQVDLERVKNNCIEKKDDVSWGPNATFRFPKKGGTGGIWRGVADQLGKHLGNNFCDYETVVEGIDVRKKIVRTQSGEEYAYEQLLSTLPLTKLLELCQLPIQAPLLSSSSHIVGIGLEGEMPEFLRTKNWIYFPEKNCPFYRVTVFSNYSPDHVPDPRRHWSLLCETSSSSFKRGNRDTIVDETIEGLRNVKLLDDSQTIVSRWNFTAELGYPTPSLDRDAIVHDALHRLAGYGVFSRGRFGVWKYEVSNQDHSFMQGFEWADWLLKGAEEITYCAPEKANAPGKRPLRAKV